MKLVARFSLSISLFLCFFLTAFGQPSGGPYGPIAQKFELPAVKGKTYFVSPGGNSESSGIKLSEPTSIEAAIAKAKTGDAIILRGGTYRTGNLVFNQGITFQAYADELPVLKGSKVATEWTPLRDNIWVTKWEHLFPSAPQGWWRRNRNLQTPLHRFNDDMVFIDGEFLQSAGWAGEVDENSFYIHYETGEVYIGQDPTNKTIEITAFNVALHRTISEAHGRKPDQTGPTIRGIHFTQYAYRAIEIDGLDPDGLSDEKDHGKDVVGTTLEHCSITFCSRVAAYLRGDKLTLRHCKISDTSTEGIFLLSSSDVLMEKNIFARNNIERITGYFPAAVKIFNQCYRVTVNDNLIIDHPYSNGVWYDVGNIDGVFTNNWVQDIGFTDFIINTSHLWPSENGFFFEISKGAICAGNVFVNCDHGVMVLNSSGVKMYNNTFINSMVAIGRDERSAQGDHFGWHPSTGPDIDERINHEFVNNLMVGTEPFSRPFFFAWQRAILCDSINDQQLKKMDNNIYVRSDQQSQKTLMIWGPGDGDNCQNFLPSLEAMRKLNPQFSQNSQFLSLEKSNIFQSYLLGKFEPCENIEELRKAGDVPDEIQDAIKAPGKINYVGAYNAKQDQ